MMASCSGEILSPKQSGASPILMGTVWSDIYLDMLYLFRIIIFSEKILFFKISQTNYFNLPLMQHYLHLYANNIQFHYILNDQLIFTDIFYKIFKLSSAILLSDKNFHSCQITIKNLFRSDYFMLEHICKPEFI